MLDEGRRGGGVTREPLDFLSGRDDAPRSPGRVRLDDAGWIARWRYTTVAQDRDQGAAELKKLADLITDPVQRKAFASDPDGVLAESDVNPDLIPQPVLDTLKGLSQEELRLLQRLHASLLASGLSVEVSGGDSLGMF